MAMHYLEYAIAVCIIVLTPVVMYLLIKHEMVKDNGGLWNWFQNLRCKLRWSTNVLWLKKLDK